MKMMGQINRNDEAPLLYLSHFVSPHLLLRMAFKLPKETVFIVPAQARTWLLNKFRKVICSDDREEVSRILSDFVPVLMLTTPISDAHGQLLAFDEKFKEAYEKNKRPVQLLYTFKNKIFPAKNIYPAHTPLSALKQSLQELSVDAVLSAVGEGKYLHHAAIYSLRKNFFKKILSDSLGVSLRGYSILARAIMISKWLKRSVGDRPHIGLLLPNVVVSALINLGLLLIGKVPVNLNYTIGQEALDKTIKIAKIERVISSRRFLEKINLTLKAETLYVEDVTKELSLKDKLNGFLLLFLPARCLCRLFTHQETNLAPATILFSSGTTGEPKGVVLSHRSLLSNLMSIKASFALSQQDRLIGTLPFFHSFGFTVTLWLPLSMGFYTFYHPNPLDIKNIPLFIQQEHISLMVTTPTFCRHYLERTEPKMFASLKRVVTGAEKLPLLLAKKFQEKFNTPVVEGYGCTELGPVVSVNVTGPRTGSVGLPMPGVAVKIVDPDTGADKKTKQDGLLLIKSAAMMQGYFDAYDLTNNAFDSGWYKTGDMAKVDEDGYIYIVDRLARFSKIGGEMVPHLKIEQAIEKTVGAGNVVVTSIPDAKRGEAIIALYAGDQSPLTVYEALARQNLPNLWLPRLQHVFAVEQIPVTGTGKVDLRTAKAMAVKLTQ